MEPFERSTEVYDLLYRDKDYAGEAAFVLERLRARGEVRELRDVLDLGCGTGRHAEELTRAGLAVIGVDRSAAMVERARSRGVDARIADVRDVRLGRTFDAVTALFHVASYLTTDDDLDRLVATAALHLVEGGLFLFDTWHAPAVAAHPPEVRTTRVDGEGLRVTRTATPVVGAHVHTIDVHLRFEIDAAGGCRAYEEVHPMRPRARAELELALARHGFVVDEYHGWRTDAPASEDTWQAYVVARRS